ncbi:3'-5' exonuclease [Hymenobacter sp. BT18]|uniref:3'-5' exonuclease n=1 Tax=Hymenobacter sp. BT18 TaxID=2835648 RepID=UPI00143EDF07|nr:3'-5' exonuclease [Hymenobacter sp. BT18]QIX61837.1 3'-5' exonuclease [Hymenobacter sp. BT18]
MPSYFKLRTGLSRGIEDGTSKKKVCTYMMQYFYRDATGRLAEITVCEDGFCYRSAASFRQQLNPEWPGKPGQKPTPRKYVEVPGDELGLPVGAVPCSAAEYDAALAQVIAAEKKAEAERLKEKEFAESLKKGMVRNQHAAEEAGVAEPLVLAPAHFLDDFTVFDTETTGFSAENCRLLEVAAVRYINWEEVDRMQSFVRFTEFIPAKIKALTGIRESDVRQAPEAKQVLARFRQLAGESLLVGHNVAFDIRFLEATRTRLGAKLPLPNKTLCTQAVSKRYDGSHVLGDLCTRFGISNAGAHRALNDVLMTYQLLRHMHQQQPIGAEMIGASGKKKATPALSLFAA